MASGELEPVAKRARLETNFKLCIYCQESSSAPIVKTPSEEAFSKFLEIVHQRAKYGDGNFPEIHRRLENLTPPQLVAYRAFWHRNCYAQAAHQGKLERAKARYEKSLQTGVINPVKPGRPLATTSNITRDCTPDQSDKSSVPFTRASNTKFDKMLCFFCQEGSMHDLHEVQSFSAGEKLQKAVEVSSNERWKVQLSSALDAEDALSIDVKYHLRCWVKHVQRNKSKASNPTISEERPQEDKTVDLIASDIEFISQVKSTLRAGEVLSMTRLESTYRDILRVNGIEHAICRKSLKAKLLQHVPDIEVSRPKQRREAENVYLKETRESIIEKAASKVKEDEMQALFKCAEILRKVISEQKPWEFTGSLSTSEARTYVPQELLKFIRWLIQGPGCEIQSQTRACKAAQIALTISQNIMYASKTDRQVRYNPKSTNSLFRSKCELPQLLAVGLTVHHATRSKKLLDLLHNFGLSVGYERVLRVETQLAKAVIQRMEIEGAYIPPLMSKGEFIFFAIDNTDFQEDTADGKNTLHGTVTAIYQRKQDTINVNRPTLEISGQANDKTLRDIPSVAFEQCKMTSVKPQNPIYEGHSVGGSKVAMDNSLHKDIAWLVAHSMVSRKTVPADDERNEQQPTYRINIPTWSAYNSLTSTSLPLTIVGTPPLVPAPAHNWETLMTVLKQAQHINTVVVGPDRKTVITLDMQLYEKAKQLEMAKEECKGKWLLRIGEMHTVMTALRAVGDSIEDSGIDAAWVAADLYGPVTTRQILEARHMKRALDAHMMTVQALHDLYMEDVLTTFPELQRSCCTAADNLKEACSNLPNDGVNEAHEKLITALSNCSLIEKLDEFDKNCSQSRPTYKFIRLYMKFVLTIFAFIRATRQGMWELHLSSLDALCKYFFAHDKQKYARMVPLYLAEMRDLQKSDPDIWHQFSQGNFVVNKNEVPFCAIGTDHGVEHVNRMMKVIGGLSGITLNPAARGRYFLTAPELARLSGEAQEMSGSTNSEKEHHHDLSRAVQLRHENKVRSLKTVLQTTTNPLSYGGDDLVNFITGVVMPQDIQEDICSRDEIGQREYEEFARERVSSNHVNIWGRMKKMKLKTWTDARKSVKAKS